MRLLDVISAAGGLQPSSSGIVSISHRDRPSEAKTIRITGPLASIENPDIKPGDTIKVERAGIVYVVGGVNRPGGFVLDGGKTVTLLQALALAEGPVKTAKLGSASLIRSSNGQATNTPVNLKDVLHSKIPDQVLQPDDILVIPSSTVREVLRAGAQGAMNIAAGMAIYHL